MNDENQPDAPTINDLREAVAGVLLVLGSTMSADAAQYMADQLKELGRHHARSGRTSAGTLLAGFAKALAEGAAVPKKAPPRH